jgi:hypothetical protein
MLTELRLPLGRWREVAGTVLAVCPLKRVEVLDVPGLTFEVLGPDACHTGDGWRMAAELKLPRRLHVLPAHFPPSFGLPAACYRRVWPDLKHLPHGYTRASLRALADAAIGVLVADLEASAGVRWPGPVPGDEVAPSADAELQADALTGEM